jgi:excisionase family DNA binding protein
MKTAKQAAADLHIHSRTVRRWIQSGHLAGEKVGDQWIIHEPDDVIASLARLHGTEAPAVRSA